MRVEGTVKNLDQQAQACLSLWSAVLVRAVHDWRSQPTRQLYRFWHSQGFLYLCRLLDLDPTWARNKIMPLKGMGRRRRG